MRNPYNSQEASNRQNFPKNNYFGYRWRVVGNFNKSIERRMFQLQAQGVGNDITLLSDRILQHYKARQHGSNMDLIADLAQDAIGFLNSRKQAQRTISKNEILLSKATASLMARTFNTFLAFSAELNSLLGMSELTISASEPETTRRTNYGGTSIATCVQSNIFTRLFRLVIEGTQDKMSFYLVPTDDIFALGEISSFEPIAVWQANFAAQDQIYWSCSAGVITDDLIDFACAELIRNLIETTQEAIAPKHTQRKAKLNKFDLQDFDPWLQETPVHTHSSEDTRTDCVPSLSSLFRDSGIFESLDAEFDTVRVDNSADPNEFVNPKRAEYTPKPEPTPASKPPEPAWIPLPTAVLDCPTFHSESNDPEPGSVIFFNPDQDDEKRKFVSSFDLKAEYYAETKVRRTNKTPGTKKKSRKKQK